MEGKTVTIHLKSYSELLDKIERLETSLEQSKSANKRIKEETKYLDYKRLLDRFNRQKATIERYETALKEIAESNEDTPFARHIILHARRVLAE